MPTVLIATTMDDGRAWLDTQPSAPRDVVIVTPRSPHAARGVTAAAVLATPAAQAHPSYDHLVAVSLPSVASVDPVVLLSVIRTATVGCRRETSASGTREVHGHGCMHRGA